MGVGAGLYTYDVVVKRSHSLSHLLTSSTQFHSLRPCPVAAAKTPDDFLLKMTFF